jgi:hypothetical protein
MGHTGRAGVLAHAKTFTSSDSQARWRVIVLSGTGKSIVPPLGIDGSDTAIGVHDVADVLQRL